jgi:hypothetical protein
MGWRWHDTTHLVQAARSRLNVGLSEANPLGFEVSIQEMPLRRNIPGSRGFPQLASDIHEKALDEWGKHISLDWRSWNEGLSHSTSVFQDPGNHILELCVWFDDLETSNSVGYAIPLTPSSQVANGGGTQLCRETSRLRAN